MCGLDSATLLSSHHSLTAISTTRQRSMRLAHASRLSFLRFLSESERAMLLAAIKPQSTPRSLSSLRKRKLVRPLSQATHHAR